MSATALLWRSSPISRRSRAVENAVVLRHYYADIFLDAKKTLRARIGQSETVVREYEPGLELSLEPGLELTAAYAIADRHYRDSGNPDNRQRGRCLRLQAQVSF